ncbi:MAG: hypothetical protein IPI23_09190 [Bacteroidetes bacterium]|nr:hypothetical protein [Bacteroidota bacterium]
MKPIYIICIFVFTCCAQKSRHQYLLKNVDEIRTQHFNSEDTISNSFSDLQRIEMFKEIINARKEILEPAKTVGLLIFLSNGDSILTVTMTKTGCKYVLDSDSFSTRLTYRVGQFWIGL